MLRGRHKVFPGLNEEEVKLIELRSGRHMRVLCISNSSIQQTCKCTGRLDDDGATKHPNINTQAKSKLNSDGNSSREDTGPHVVVVFMLHGVGGSIDVWSSQIDFLLSKTDPYLIVAVDFLGHGHSSAPRDVTAYDFFEYRQDIIELFKRYHGQKNFIIGHSYGLVSQF
jgi:pimeloyl-ACP methyl ester carboxylesterase